MVQKIVISESNDSLEVIKSVKPHNTEYQKKHKEKLDLHRVQKEGVTVNRPSTEEIVKPEESDEFTDIEKLLMFDYELSLIDSKEIRNFVETCLKDAPSYFWYVPASSTGKYHSKESNGVGGLINHVKMTIKIARDLFRLEEYESLIEKKDLIYSALLLHDIIKYGFEKGTWVLYEHPLLAQKYILMESQKEYNEIKAYAAMIGELVSTHSGQWNTNHEGKVIMNKPETPEAKFVHLCDYIASRSYVG